MIKIKESQKNTKKTKPHYLLTYNYMIGDANGYTKYISLLNNLKPLKNHWGFILSSEDIRQAFKEKQITEDDYNFLCYMMHFDDVDGEDAACKFIVEEKNEEFADEFVDGVRSDNDYSFLVFDGVDLKYIDEFGNKYETEIVK